MSANGGDVSDEETPPAPTNAAPAPAAQPDPATGAGSAAAPADAAVDSADAAPTAGQKRPREAEAEAEAEASAEAAAEGDDDTRSVRSSASATATAAAAATPVVRLVGDAVPGRAATVRHYVPDHAGNEAYSITFDSHGQPVKMAVRIWANAADRHAERTPLHQPSSANRLGATFAYPNATASAKLPQLLLQALAAVHQSEQAAWREVARLAARLGGPAAPPPAEPLAQPQPQPQHAQHAQPQPSMALSQPQPLSQPLPQPPPQSESQPPPPPPPADQPLPTPLTLAELLPEIPPPPDEVVRNFVGRFGPPVHKLSEAAMQEVQQYKLVMRHDFTLPSDRRRMLVCAGPNACTLLGRFPHGKFVQPASKKKTGAAGNEEEATRAREVFVVTRDRRIDLSVFLVRKDHPAGAPRDLKLQPVTEQTLAQIIRKDAGALWDSEQAGLKYDEKHFYVEVYLVFDDGDGPWNRTRVTPEHFTDHNPDGGSVFVPAWSGNAEQGYHQKLINGELKIDFALAAGAYTFVLRKEYAHLEFRLQARCTCPHTPHLLAESVPFMTKSALGKKFEADDRYVAAPLVNGVAPEPWYNKVTNSSDLKEKAARPKPAATGRRVTAKTAGAGTSAGTPAGTSA